MSYFEKIDQAINFPLINPDHKCFVCGDEIADKVVVYDGLVANNYYNSLLLHPACAVLMGNRLISDGFKHRR